MSGNHMRLFNANARKLPIKIPVKQRAACRPFWRINLVGTACRSRPNKLVFA
jgi:hypothetical protein